MSTRFKINDFQVYDNWEIEDSAFEFMRNNGAEIFEDYTFGDTEVTDLDGLIKAITTEKYKEKVKWLLEYLEERGDIIRTDGRYKIAEGRKIIVSFV